MVLGLRFSDEPLSRLPPIAHRQARRWRFCACPRRRSRTSSGLLHPRRGPMDMSHVKQGSAEPSGVS
jgi:hypothetical protein